MIYNIVKEAIILYKVSEFTKNTYRVNEVAKLLGVTPHTIRAYANNDKIKTARTEGNQRIIMRNDLLELLKEKNMLYDDIQTEKIDVIYTRVMCKIYKR